MGSEGDDQQSPLLGSYASSFDPEKSFQRTGKNFELHSTPEVVVSISYFLLREGSHVFRFYLVFRNSLKMQAMIVESKILSVLKYRKMK